MGSEYIHVKAFSLQLLLFVILVEFNSIKGTVHLILSVIFRHNKLNGSTFCVIFVVNSFADRQFLAKNGEKRERLNDKFLKRFAGGFF